MSFFKKLSRRTSDLFKKVDKGGDNFFRKLGNSIETGANIVGREINRDGKVIGGGLQKAGNFLEKNAVPISIAAAGLASATGFGAPVAAGILSAGTAAQAYGSRAKQAGQSIQRFTNNANATLTNSSNMLQNTIGNARSGFRTANGNVINTLDGFQ